MMRAFFLGVPTDAASAKVCQLTHAADAGAADRSPKSENPKSEVRRSEVRTFTRFFDDIIDSVLHEIVYAACDSRSSRLSEC